MIQEDSHIEELIATYLSKGLDSGSWSELKSWIETSSDHERYFMQQQEIWFSAIENQDATLYNKEQAFDQFQKRVKKTIPNKLVTNKNTNRFSAIWRYAAVVALLIAVSYFSYWQGGVEVKEHFTDMIVEAPLGSRTKLYLPDGTLVWLNAGSRMVYSQGFGVDNRKVELVGEGYFEVKRNEELPFLVTTNDLQVRVLGTKFNFRNYQEDNEAIVSLVEGKVALDNLRQKQKETLLLPNQRVILNKETGRMQVESVMASNASEWTNGYLFFDEELLPDITEELQRSYNVEIAIVSESLKNFRFYGNFVRRDQTILDVMEALSATGKIHYKIEGRKITLYE